MTTYKKDDRKSGSIWRKIGFGLCVAAVLVEQHREIFECSVCRKRFEAGVRQFVRDGIRGVRTNDWRLSYNTLDSRPLVCPHCRRLNRCRRCYF